MQQILLFKVFASETLCLCRFREQNPFLSLANIPHFKNSQG